MYRITKQFSISAAHSLPLMSVGHKCREIHGHNYVITLVLEAKELDHTGMVLDFGALDRIKHWLGNVADHKDLNSIQHWNPTTCEHIAKCLYDSIRAMGITTLTRVIVSETPITSGEYWE